MFCGCCWYLCRVSSIMDVEKSCNMLTTSIFNAGFDSELAAARLWLCSERFAWNTCHLNHQIYHPQFQQPVVLIFLLQQQHHHHHHSTVFIISITLQPTPSSLTTLGARKTVVCRSSCHWWAILLQIAIHRHRIDVYPPPSNNIHPSFSIHNTTIIIILLLPYIVQHYYY